MPFCFPLKVHLPHLGYLARECKTENELGSHCSKHVRNMSDSLAQAALGTGKCLGVTRFQHVSGNRKRKLLYMCLKELLIAFFKGET